MKQVNIYIEEVVKYLPRQLKEEVKKDLTSQIMDMIEESEGDDKAINAILESMGSPKALADRYLNKEKGLIGPRYYDAYITIVKIVMFALALAFSITFAMKLIFTDNFTFWMVLEYPVSLLNAAIMGFAYVTIIFAFIERNQVKIDDKDLIEKPWSINDLPKENVESSEHRFENIFEIGFATILMFIINFQPQLIGIYSSITNQGETVWSVTPLLNEMTRGSWLIWVNAWLIMLLISGVIKAIYRLGKKQRLLYSSLFDFIALVLFMIILTTQKVIVDNVAGLIAPGNAEFELLVNRGSLAVLIVILTLSQFEIIRNVIKAFKLKA
jgi:hypothetical protein